MRSLGIPEILMILAVATLLFGPKKFGEALKGIGDGIRELKKAGHEAKDAEKELKNG